MISVATNWKRNWKVTSRKGISLLSSIPTRTIPAGFAWKKKSYVSSENLLRNMMLLFWKTWLTSLWTSGKIWANHSKHLINHQWHIIQTTMYCSFPALKHSAMPDSGLVSAAFQTSSIIALIPDWQNAMVAAHSVQYSFTVYSMPSPPVRVIRHNTRLPPCWRLLMKGSTTSLTKWKYMVNALTG